jgi:hypothetical protein
MEFSGAAFPRNVASRLTYMPRALGRISTVHTASGSE